jgi:glyoxylase-like metal-dependent hydrolase (beta-lactamase superfamily II)
MTIHTIDLHYQDTPGLIAAYVLQSGSECALIETGPGSCHATLFEGLRVLGLEATDIRKVFVTHIHLDHSGASGWWAQQGAQVFVHPRGAPHIIDPTKLIDSATRIYGDQMQELWGDILPAPAQRVASVNDGDRIRVGDVEIEAWDTPGHARHHHAFVVGDVCFTGDVAGMVVPGCDYLSVTAAPPQFEPEAYLASVARLRAANFRQLYLTHFGAIDDPASHLDRYADRIRQVHQNVATWQAAGLTSAEIAEHFAATEKATAGLSEADWLHYEQGNNTAMCAAGIELFVVKSHHVVPKL